MSTSCFGKAIKTFLSKSLLFVTTLSIVSAAMARPVITTDVPGCRQVVEHTVIGFVSAPQDIDNLTIQVRRFLELPHTKRPELGEAGRRRAEREFEHGLVVQKYRAALHAIGSPSHIGYLQKRASRL